MTRFCPNCGGPSVTSDHRWWVCLKCGRRFQSTEELNGPAGGACKDALEKSERSTGTSSDTWAVTVERNGEQVVTIASNMLAGRDLSTR